MARKNPYRRGTKYHFMFEVFSEKVIPGYPEVLERINNEFPGDHTTVNSLKRFKSVMRRDGHKVGRQTMTRTMKIPTPRQAARALELAADTDRLEYVRELLTALGYKEAARWVK